MNKRHFIAIGVCVFLMSSVVVFQNCGQEHELYQLERDWDADSVSTQDQDYSEKCENNDPGYGVAPDGECYPMCGTLASSEGYGPSEHQLVQGACPTGWSRFQQQSLEDAKDASGGTTCCYQNAINGQCASGYIGRMNYAEQKGCRAGQATNWNANELTWNCMGVANGEATTCILGGNDHAFGLCDKSGKRGYQYRNTCYLGCQAQAEAEGYSSAILWRNSYECPSSYKALSATIEVVAAAAWKPQGQRIARRCCAYAPESASPMPSPSSPPLSSPTPTPMNFVEGQCGSYVNDSDASCAAGEWHNHPGHTANQYRWTCRSIPHQRGPNGQKREESCTQNRTASPPTPSPTPISSFVEGKCGTLVPNDFDAACAAGTFHTHPPGPNWTCRSIPHQRGPNGEKREVRCSP